MDACDETGNFYRPIRAHHGHHQGQTPHYDIARLMQYEILIDHSERANKCTILPLGYREDFCLARVPQHKIPTINPVIPKLKSVLLLHPDGIDITTLSNKPLSTHSSIAAIDCVWRRLDPIMSYIEKPLPQLVRIPEGFVTAYPRKTKFDFDPDSGLATIEALFIAAALLGHWDTTLLHEYFFGAEFLRLNSHLFSKYGVDIKTQTSASLFQPRFVQNAKKRRVYRGRVNKIEARCSTNMSQLEQARS
jgi:ribosome biogenesis protein Tsr3